MTAKHRKGKSNHKQEDNFFKSEVLETEVRPGGSNHAPLLVSVLIAVIGCIIGAWFLFQQHSTLTDLSDNVMGIQVKIAKLQSSHEELRLSNTKQHVSENVETRLASLEESYALAQKQVGMALATAEQLKTSDLPAQVLSLHTEMKTRLAEVQQATVSLEQLSQLQSVLMGKSVEFEDIRIQVEDLAALSGELSQKVEDLSLNLAEAELKLEEKIVHIATMSATLDGQTNEVLKLKNQLDTYQVQLENSLLETANLRELLENKESQLFLKTSEVEQAVDQTLPPAEHLEKMEADAAEEQEVVDNEDGTDYKEEVTATEEEEVEVAAVDDEDKEEAVDAAVEEMADAETEKEGEIVETEEKQTAGPTEELLDNADMSEEKEEEAGEHDEDEEEAGEHDEDEEEAGEHDEDEEEAGEHDEDEEEAGEHDEDEEEAGEHDEDEEEVTEPEVQIKEVAEPEERMDKADATETESQPAAGAEEAPTSQEGEEVPVVPGEEDTEKTGEEPPAAEDKQEVSSKQESLQQDGETKATATEGEEDDTEQEKLMEKVHEGSTAIVENQETVMEGEETKEDKNEEMEDMIEEEEDPQEEEYDISEELAFLENK